MQGFRTPFLGFRAFTIPIIDIGGPSENVTASGFSVQSFTDGGVPKKGILMTSSTTGTVNVTGTYRRILIAGGGSGGSRGNGRAGGGGAGEVYEQTSVSLTAGSFVATIGAGGAGIPSSEIAAINGSKGGNSIWTGNGASATVEGGGYGGGANEEAGGNGGSGGGAPVQSATPGISTALLGLGNDGGIGIGAPTSLGGAGGGAGGPPPSDDGAFGDNRGPGVTIKMFGIDYLVGQGGDGNVSTPTDGNGYGSGSDGGLGSGDASDGLVYIEWTV